jgi:hypothetical protein
MRAAELPVAERDGHGNAGGRGEARHEARRKAKGGR